MFTLKAYGDESADETRSRVFAIAVVFGTDDEWAIAMKDWLRRTRGLRFHATDCESAHGRTDERHQDDLRLYKDLTTLLAESHLVGMAIALDLVSLRRCLPDTPSETAYCKCFTDILRNTGTMAKRVDGEERNSQFEYVFDSRLETDGTASQIYEMFRNLPEWLGTNTFGANVTFEAGDEPRLEMADLLAREAMKELDRKVTGARSKRRSYEALENASFGGTRKFIFVEYGGDYCESWRDKINEPQSQEDLRAYQKWLADTGCIQDGHVHDTQANRARFYGWLEAKEALLKRRG